MIHMPCYLMPCPVATLPQNLCKDTSVARLLHQAVGMQGPEDWGARVEMEDCLLETMTGSAAFIVRQQLVALYPPSNSDHVI
jgi:hypothetical protein